jgi:energy-coupling factor transporter ATP-binding protein EcfA2
MAGRRYIYNVSQITHKFGKKVIDIMLDFKENIVGGDRMSIQIITNYATNAITSACGLDINQAKTIVYYAVATHGMGQLKIMPILVLLGGHGTGKSTLIDLLKQICHSPITIDGKVSKAELRDSLKSNTTALIEEADNLDERLILMRYARQTASTSVKRGSASQGWSRESLNLFGATVLHRRLPFRDPAVDSRSITIKTALKPGSYTMPTLDGAALASISASVDWSKTLTIPDGRAGDTWMPLFQAALVCNDTDWLQFALGELNKALASLSVGQEYEPSQLVVSKLVSSAIDPNSQQVKQRVPLKDITKGLKDDGYNLNSWQVGKILRDLGFVKKLSGGTDYIYIDKAHLLDVAKQLGIDDDALKQMTP